MPHFFLLLMITPIIELWLILKVGSVIGAGWTIILIFLTAIVGALMLRKQGFSTLFRARQKMQEGQMPAREMAEGIMLAIAGALMLTPGFITDGVGFLLLLPWARNQLISRLLSSFIFSEVKGQKTYYYSSDEQSETIIEGEFTTESASDHKKLS